MVRSGELPCRLLALRYGADLVWGPETVDRSMIGTTRRINPRTACIEWSRASSHAVPDADGTRKENVLYRVDPSREKGKLIYQIGTSNPELAVQSATLVAADVSGIDVNAGCPKSFSTASGMGAALLKTPDLLASILVALVEKVGKVFEIGISVKIRLLETPELTEALVRKLCGTGITGLTVHCRTTPMRPRERAIREQLKMIGTICQEHGVACLMNGDVRNREEALELAKDFGVDGGMIATAAESNPSVFRTSAQGGLAPWRELAEQYLRLAMGVENKWGNTKFSLGQLIPGKAFEYRAMTATKSYGECVKALGFDNVEMMEMAVKTDDLLGLNEPMLSKAEKKLLRKQVKRALAENDGNQDNRPAPNEKRQKLEHNDEVDGEHTSRESHLQVATA